MDNINCKVLEKLKKEKKISADELQKITTIAKEEIKFMVRNNIPLVPENYILWFSIFCHIIENDLKLSDLEIMGLFKEKYPSTKEIEAVIVEFEKDEKEFVAHIAESINREISELLTSLEVHQEKLAEKQKDVEKAKDKVSDEYTRRILVHIVNQLDEIREQNDSLKFKLKESRKQIEELRKELKETEEKASIDFLTKVANRASFDRALSDMMKDFNEKSYPFALLMIDIDDFKKINDTYGHRAGDKVLRDLAKEIRSLLRARDVVARYGGEEFAVILPGSSFGQAIRIAERIRKSVEKMMIIHDDKTIPVTVSIGVAAARKGIDETLLIEMADKALYLAKRSGKNQVKTDLDVELEGEK